MFVASLDVKDVLLESADYALDFCEERCLIDVFGMCGSTRSDARDVEFDEEEAGFSWEEFLG